MRRYIDIIERSLTEAVDTSSIAFKAWFRNSKVVDAAGNPLEVYHGTNADFHEFSNTFLGSNTTANNTSVGHFFTNSANVASDFADKSGGRVIPVYLSIQKPFLIEPSSLDYTMMKTSYEMHYRVGAPARRHYRPNKDPYHQLYDWVMTLKKTKGIEGDEITSADCVMLREQLISKGFDGIIILETYMDAPAGINSGMHNFYIAFNPDQIASAVSDKPV